jgi:prevent-host-death family protein
MEVEIQEAKRQFSQLLRRVTEGEEVTITNAGVPVARLVRIEEKPAKKRPMGMDRGKIWIAEDFDAPLPDDLLRLFYGEKPAKIKRGKNK